MSIEADIKKEINTQKQKEEICANIIKRIEEKYYVSFEVKEQGYTYGNMLQILLLYPKFEKYRFYLLFLLKEYQVKESALIFRLINLLHQKNMPILYQKYLEEGMEKIPYFKKVCNKNGKYDLQTTIGDFQVENLENHVDIKLKTLLNMYPFQGNCHESVQILSNFFKTSQVVTSALPDIFGGIFYHSYFVEEGHVFDISNNHYYDKNVLKELFQAEEIMNMPTSVFQEKVKTIGSMKYAPTLQLALQEKK